MDGVRRLCQTSCGTLICNRYRTFLAHKKADNKFCELDDDEDFLRIINEDIKMFNKGLDQERLVFSRLGRNLIYRSLKKKTPIA